MSTSAPSTQRADLEPLAQRLDIHAPPEEQAGWLEELIEVYAQIPAADVEQRRKARELFLRAFERTSTDHLSERAGCFLAEEVQPEDFNYLDLNDTEGVISICENLYDLQLPDSGQENQVRRHVRYLLSSTLQGLEAKRDFERIATVLLQVPPALVSENSYLRRIRNRAHLFEQRRARRIRRGLYIYLLLQAILVLLVFPFLFINAENGAIQRELEQATELELDEERIQMLTYGDGVYWAVITAASVGYGDITPVTHLGKVLAAMLGVMGVITVGITAGLVLEWVSPRSF